MDAVPTVSTSRNARWPWIAFGTFFGMALLGLIGVAVNDESIAAQLPFMVAFGMFGIVGALIAARDRGNVIGLLLLGASVVTACSFAAGELFTWMLRSGYDGRLAVVMGFANNFGWLLGVLPVIYFLPLLFPDGRLPTRRWRWYVRFVLAFLAVVSIGFVLGQTTLTGSDDSFSVANPFYTEAFGRFPSLDPLIGVLFPGLFALSILSLILRFRRSSGLVRQQITWVVFGLVAALVGILAGDLLDDAVLNAVVVGGAFLAFPVSIGVAVLRFRLYDLDVVVKKTVVFAALALFATIVYLTVVVVLGAWLGRGNSLLTMVAAIVVAATFQPVRARITHLADRLVYGRRATPYEVLSEFGERLGDTYAADDVLPRIAKVLCEGVGADRARVWLRVGDELRTVATWPQAAPPDAPDDVTVPVVHTGEELGALSVSMPATDPINPSKEKLVRDLAAQAGLVLSNVRLTEELRARLDDLRAAQRRLVSAQDAERKRLERNIHDGAQQQLVALAVKVRLADVLVDRDPVKAHETLAQVQTETAQALDDLRDLARGIYPPLLADQGLVAALEAQVRKAALPVAIEAETIGRGPQEVEAALYFSVLEALQNVAKYADASRVAIRLTRVSHAVTFVVTDDGRGFDPTSTGYGTGLQGMLDRLGALDGSLEIASAPGAGTTVTGTVPF